MNLPVRVRALFARHRLDVALDEELRTHLEMLADDYVRGGMSRDEARRQARLRLGGLEQTKEAVRDARATWFDSISQDVRFALRGFRRAPGFTAVALLTLALGIGATTAFFSIVNTVVFRPLPYPEPGRLMALLSTHPSTTSAAFGSAQGVFLDWRERSKSFDLMAGTRATTMLWSGIEQSRELAVGRVSDSFFALVGVRPLVGRTFTRDEDREGAGKVAVLDAQFWRAEFGGRPVVGRVMVLDDTPYTIVGVVPSDGRFSKVLEGTDVWLPMAAMRRARAGGDVVTIGRLRRGVTPGAAQAEMDGVMRGIGREHQEDSKTGVRVEPLQEYLVGNVRRSFLMLLGAVGFVLLVGCANIANLLLARATVRQKEMAIRASLGAGRLRLARQVLVESLVLALLGGACGVAIAVVAVRAVPGITALDIPRVAEIAVDYRMLVAAGAISLASAILFGAIPALRAGGQDLRAVLQQGDAPTSGRAGGHRLRYVLVVGQLALTLVLLCGAGLMVNTLLRLMNIDLGFERANLLAIDANLPYKRYDREKSLEFYRRLADAVRAIPGVRGVTFADWLPLMEVHFPYDVRREGAPPSDARQLEARHVGPAYFRTAGIQLVAGRDFEPGDDDLEPAPVVVNRAAARAVFGTDVPIGRRLTAGYRDRKALQIIGVARDVHQFGVKTQPGLQLYLSAKYHQPSYLIARVASNSHALTAATRGAVHALDPGLPAPTVLAADRFFSEEVAEPRFYLALLGAFAVSAVLLVLIGVYGVLSYTIARRTHEFGVRLALGADRRDILHLLFGLGGRLAAAGLVLGTGGALALTRFLSAQLYGVRPGDPLTLACAALALLGVVLAVCGLAARRATRIDPVVALRCE